MQQYKFYLAIALTSLFAVVSLDQCVEQRLCYCHLEDGSYIDVSPVGSSRFDLIDPNGVYKYSIEVCQTFNLSKDCENVFGCQYSSESGKYNVLGRSSPTFADKGTMKIQIGSSITYINLECTSGVDILSFSDSFPGISPFNFTLQTKYACPQYKTSTANPQNVTSTSTNPSRVTSSAQTAVTTTASGTTTRSRSSSTPAGTTKITPSSPTTSDATHSSRTTTMNLPSTTHNGKGRSPSSIGAIILSMAASALSFSVC
ncbi:unnamed protein product [Lymnaea stagnalis]|uniref:Uncharacterized protein n=1 Tax=Lymnaea stagnalis TaxID=6523 RepID=A0AAV2HI60_LYMST